MPFLSLTVMWSETVGLNDKTGLRPKKSVLVLYAVVLVFVLQVWCCVVKHGLVMIVVISNYADWPNHLYRTGYESGVGAKLGQARVI